MTTQLLNGLTKDQADALAAGLKPSWYDFFGAPVNGPAGPDSTAARSPGAIAARASAASREAARPNRAPARENRSDDAPKRERKVASANVARLPQQTRAIEEDALPTTDTPWGKIVLGLAGAAALVGAVVMFSSGDETAAEPATQDQPTDAKAVAPKPKAAAPAATPSPKPAATPRAPADPEPPAPAAVEPEPAPEPAPVTAEPEPAPRVTPAPAPPRPTPAPKATPKPTPKPGGGIVRDAPF